MGSQSGINTQSAFEKKKQMVKAVRERVRRL